MESRSRPSHPLNTPLTEKYKTGVSHPINPTKPYFSNPTFSRSAALTYCPAVRSSFCPFSNRNPMLNRVTLRKSPPDLSRGLLEGGQPPMC